MKPTPVDKLAEAEKNILDLTGKLQTAEASVADLTGKLAKANTDLTDANTKLAEANRLLAEANVKVTKAEGDLKVEVEAHNLLKADFDKKVVAAASAKASEVTAGIAAGPVDTKVAAKPGEGVKTERPKDYLSALAAGAKVDLEKINGK